MDITFKDLIKLWGKPVNQKQIDLNLPVGYISTDSRTIEKGDFFVPLVGNKFDGHDYLDIASDIGIQAAIVSQQFHGLVPADLPYWVVKDTLYAYQQIAMLHRRNLNLPVVAVTGSVGKTTTRELIRAILSPLVKLFQAAEMKIMMSVFQKLCLEARKQMLHLFLKWVCVAWGKLNVSLELLNLILL